MSGDGDGRGDKHIVVGAECRNSDCDWGPLGTDSPVLDWDIIERLRTQHEDDTSHQTRVEVVDEERIVPSDSDRFQVGDTVLSLAEERGEHVDWICPECHRSGEELDAGKRCPDCEERLKMVYPDGGEEVGRAIAHETRVGHCKADETDVYAGRGPNARDMTETPAGERGWLGNPYTVDDYDRAESIARFREAFYQRLDEDDEFREAVRDLSGDVLGCWCQRLDKDEPACHAEVIAHEADRLASGGRGD